MYPNHTPPKNEVHKITGKIPCVSDFRMTFKPDTKNHSCEVRIIAILHESQLHSDRIFLILSCCDIYRHSIYTYVYISSGQSNVRLFTTVVDHCEKAPFHSWQHKTLCFCLRHLLRILTVATSIQPRSLFLPSRIAGLAVRCHRLPF